MVLFLSWRPPSPQRQKACVDASGGAFNYDAHYRGASEGAASDEAEAALARGGFHVNRARVLLGSGADTFRRAKSALCAWRHFRLGWAFVEEETPVEKGTKFCVCVKEILPWMAMPLQIAYVADASSGGESAGLASGTGELRRPSGNSKASFSFGSGTLRGHLLAGEERFSVEWDDNDQVFYEIFSFSKPAHMLSAIGYPYVRLRQKHFAQESGRAILKHLASEKPTE
ncbi:unnamed protein product [Spirodela intermedia]|uniref:DUF1990 domain-containing protein n=2 Tax=Spirodela intermedia TaxID=51605 RepID=A0A7I8IE34_SPIIN|nr:unnamed protein product [Spirodela intermedia]CAA6656050.1 unnamed protein product [Spirodela intermedia]CAA7391482.1 unnamed protein product [Spirodela intermedia]